MTRIAAPSTAAGNSDAYGFVPFTARPLPGRPIRVVVEHGGKPAVACASASQNQSEPAVSKPPPLGRYLRPTGPASERHSRHPAQNPTPEAGWRATRRKRRRRRWRRGWDSNPRGPFETYRFSRSAP